MSLYNDDLQVLLDRPDGINLRITYARVYEAGVVAGIAILTPVEPIEGVATFGLAYAVSEQLRGKGLAVDIVTKALEEFGNGMARRGLREFYVEAIVGVGNAASNAVARKVLSENPKEGIDSISGEPIQAYVKLIKPESGGID